MGITPCSPYTLREFSQETSVVCKGPKQRKHIWGHAVTIAEAACQQLTRQKNVFLLYANASMWPIIRPAMLNVTLARYACMCL